MKDFNEHIKDTLHHYGEEPDDIVWDTLKNNLLTNKRKKRRMVFFVVLAILGISSTFAIFSLQNGDSNKSSNVYKSGEVKILNTTNTNPKPEKVTSPKITTYRIKTVKNSALIIKNLESNTTRILENEVIKSKTNKVNKLVVTTIEPISVESIVSFPSLPFKQLVFSGNFETISQLNTQLPMKKALLPSRYFVKLMVIPTLNNKLLNGKPAIAISGKENEIFSNGINIGITTGKPLNRNIDISAGIGFAYYTQQVTHSWTNKSIFNDSLLVQSRKNREVYYYHFMDTAYKNYNQTYTNKFKLIHLPVNIQFKKPLSLRTSLYASAGINFTYIFKASVNTRYSEDKGMQIEKTPHQESYRRLGAAGEIGFGLILRLNNLYEVSGGLHSTLSTNYFINGISKEYPFIPGLQMAIRRNF